MLAIKECLLVEHGKENGESHALITLDDALIEVRLVDGAAPSPFLLITNIEATGFSGEQFDTFNRDPENYKALQRALELYDELVANERMSPVDPEIEAIIRQRFNEGSLVTRLEGRDSALIAIGEKVSAHIVFFGFGSIQLGTVVSITTH